MANFRKLAKESRLKPKHVAIPQFDPLRELEAPPQKPKQQQTRQPRAKPATAAQKEKQPEPTPAATDDVANYKSKYLQKEDEKVTKTFRMYKWRFEQLEREMHDTGLKEWQIIDVGLEMYFRDKRNEP